MIDNVQAMIRETLLHKNALEDLSFNPSECRAVISLLQPNDRYQYPDYLLVFTFSGVKSLEVSSVGVNRVGENVFNIKCSYDEGMYKAEFALGEVDRPSWLLRIEFSDLHYKRSPSFP